MTLMHLGNIATCGSLKYLHAFRNLNTIWSENLSPAQLGFFKVNAESIFTFFSFYFLLFFFLKKKKKKENTFKPLLDLKICPAILSLYIKIIINERRESYNWWVNCKYFSEVVQLTLFYQILNNMFYIIQF